MLWCIRKVPLGCEQLWCGVVSVTQVAFALSGQQTPRWRLHVCLSVPPPAVLAPAWGCWGGPGRALSLQEALGAWWTRLCFHAFAWAPRGSSTGGDGWALLPKWDPCSGVFIWTVGDWTRGSSFLLNLHPAPSAKLHFYRSCRNIERYPRATGFQCSVCPLSFYFCALL